jgi:hypothetical protein
MKNRIQTLNPRILEISARLNNRVNTYFMHVFPSFSPLNTIVLAWVSAKMHYVALY